MSTADQPRVNYHTYVIEGLQELRRALEPFAEASLRRHYGGEWREQAVEVLRRGGMRLIAYDQVRRDIFKLLKLIRDNPEPFAATLGPRGDALVRRLLAVRHESHHDQELTLADSLHAHDWLCELLLLIGHPAPHLEERRRQLLAIAARAANSVDGSNPAAESPKRPQRQSGGSPGSGSEGSPPRIHPPPAMADGTLPHPGQPDEGAGRVDRGVPQAARTERGARPRGAAGYLAVAALVTVAAGGWVLERWGATNENPPSTRVSGGDGESPRRPPGAETGLNGGRRLGPTTPVGVGNSTEAPRDRGTGDGGAKIAPACRPMVLPASGPGRTRVIPIPSYAVEAARRQDRSWRLNNAHIIEAFRAATSSPDATIHYLGGYRWQVAIHASGLFYESEIPLITNSRIRISSRDAAARWAAFASSSWFGREIADHETPEVLVLEDWPKDVRQAVLPDGTAVNVMAVGHNYRGRLEIIVRGRGLANPAAGTFLVSVEVCEQPSNADHPVAFAEALNWFVERVRRH